MRYLLIALIILSCVGCVSGKGRVNVDYPIGGEAKITGGLDFTFTR
jgi:hypothetical protein